MWNLSHNRDDGFTSIQVNENKVTPKRRIRGKLSTLDLDPPTSTPYSAPSPSKLNLAELFPPPPLSSSSSSSSTPFPPSCSSIPINITPFLVGGRSNNVCLTHSTVPSNEQRVILVQVSYYYSYFYDY